jgi:chromosome segregation ATPase
MVVIVALVAMKVFLTRSVQSKYRDGADVFGGGEQYAKGTRVTNLDGATLPPPVTPPVIIEDCPYVVAEVERLETDIANLRKQADDYDKAAAQIEEAIPYMQQQRDALLNDAATLESQASDKRAEAASYTAQADALQADLEAAQQAYEDNNCRYYVGCCDPEYGTGICCDCDALAASIAQLPIDIADLRSKAAAAIADAESKEATAATKRSQAAQIDAAITRLIEEKAEFTEMADDARNDADDEQETVDQYRSDYPECF